MFVAFWTLEQAGSVTWGFEDPEKLLMGGKSDQAGVGGMCCSSPGTSTGDGYRAGSTPGLKKHMHPGDIRMRPKRFYWSLETTSCNRKILCYKPHLGPLPLSVRSNGAPFDKPQNCFLPEEGGEPTVPLPSDPPPPAALGMWLSCDSEDPKNNLFSPM